MSIIADKAKELLARHREKARGRDFLEATMAASALVASADGEIALAELLSRDEVLDRVAALQTFDVDEAVTSFAKFAAAIDADRTEGVAEALAAVGRVGADPEMSQLLLRVALAIAKADARYSAEEQAMIVQLGETLGAEAVDLSADEE